MPKRSHPTIDDRQNVISKSPELCSVVADPNQRRSLVGELLRQLFDGVPRLAIQRCSRFVSKEDHRARHQRAGNTHPLCLATREVSSIAVQQFSGKPDVIEQVERPLLANVRDRDPKVVEHRPGEQRRSLEHHGHLAAQFVRLQLVKSLPLPSDLTIERIIQTIEQPQQGRLTGP